ncbi:hypothetical protein PVAP13_5NG380681 [Panicum virgatum]|uniref:Uncharacterized protein n=1 Tax=Panicum virgatum TaxID=38727 RepID=A0A8T0RYL8_PANVG|nr:hypothetical protein PVAP13_5NG380681 [Panicum virgatum]
MPAAAAAERVRGKVCGQLAAGHRCGAAQGADRSRGGPAATAAVERAGSWRVAAAVGTREPAVGCRRTGSSPSPVAMTVEVCVKTAVGPRHPRRLPLLPEGPAHAGGEEGPLRDEARRPQQQAGGAGRPIDLEA